MYLAQESILYVHVKNNNSISCMYKTDACHHLTLSRRIQIDLSEKAQLDGKFPTQTNTPSTV